MKFKSNFFTKLTHWEFWPTWLVYMPVVFFYFYLSMRSRSFFFFTKANPDMEMGGLYNCSKFLQLNKLPDPIKPKTIFLPAGATFVKATEGLRMLGIDFPIIAKPDRGERGVGVRLIENSSQLSEYLKNDNIDILLQEFIQSPFEAGVFYYRMPGENSGKIPSIVLKEFLTVIGDGKSNLKKLVDQIPRGRLVSQELFKNGRLNPNEILATGSKKLLEPIGNHNRGTRFLDGTDLRNAALIQFFDGVSHMLGSFYYGRIDLKATSLEEFIQAKGIKILEINGVNAEPAHIYDPHTKLSVGVATLLKHWKIIFHICKENNGQDHSSVSLKEAWNHYVHWQKVKKMN